MTQITVSELRDHIADTLNRVAFQGERIILERHGKPQVALIPVEDLELLKRLEDKEDIEDARKALAEDDFVSIKQARKELGL